MSPIVIAILVLAALIIATALAFAVYKAGFRATKLKIKTGPVETELERSPTQTADSATTESATPTQFSQEATSGGVIRKASIKAPADSPAGATQEAKGKGSRLEDTRIELE